jgi:hypothetical protein
VSEHHLLKVFGVWVGLSENFCHHIHHQRAVGRMNQSEYLMQQLEGGNPSLPDFVYFLVVLIFDEVTLFVSDSVDDNDEIIEQVLIFHQTQESQSLLSHGALWVKFLFRIIIVKWILKQVICIVLGLELLDEVDQDLH